MNYNFENKPSRRAILHIPYRMVAELLMQPIEPRQYMQVIRTKGLPLDTKICGVHVDYARDCFVFILEHESFAPIYPGSEYPVIPWETINFNMRRMVFVEDLPEAQMSCREMPEDEGQGQTGQPGSLQVESGRDVKDGDEEEDKGENKEDQGHA